MTDLTTLLHDRADRARLQPIDLDAVTRTGEGRVRRRRATTYAGALAVTGVLTTTALLGWPGQDRALEPAAPAASGPSTAGASWFLDGRLHHDGTSTDLGLAVTTYVRTGVGFVLVDTDDVVWSWTGGAPQRVGVAADAPQRLAGDSDGTWAAWIDASGPDRGVVALDQVSGELRTLRGVDATQEEVAVTAVEGDRVWWVEGERSLSFTWADRALERYADGTRVLAAEGERLVYEVDAEVRTSLGTPGPHTVLDRTYRDVGALSPDGALWSADADAVRVVRTSDGADLPFGLDAEFSTGFEWLDARRLVVLVGERSPDGGGDLSGRLAVCDVVDGGCTDVSGDLGPFADLEAGDFALAVGVELG